MRTYKVLEAHLGDKEYKPGDMRELAPADAKSLTDLGLVELADGEVSQVGDGDNVTLTAAEYADMRTSFEALGKARDDAQDATRKAEADRDAARSDATTAAGDLARAVEARTAAETDRDAARASLDEAQSQIETLRTENADLKTGKPGTKKAAS